MTPPRPRLCQQSPRHGATRPAAIPMAQRHRRDTPSSNPQGTAPLTPHTRRARDADPNGTAPHTVHARRARNADPNGTELTTHRATTRSYARRRDARQQAKRTRVQPPDPQTINGNPSLRFREKDCMATFTCSLFTYYQPCHVADSSKRRAAQGADSFPKGLDDSGSLCSRFTNIGSSSDR